MLPDYQDSAKKSVLIVDRSADNREVLRTALQRRGLQTLEASGAHDGLELAREHKPEIIILDLGDEAADDLGVEAAFDAQTRLSNATLVVLGKVRCRAADVPRRRWVTKPYHYGPLIRTIEELLSQRVSS